VEVAGLDHRLTNGLGGLLYLGDDGGVVEDAAGHLAVSPAQAQDEVEGGLLLDVVVGEGASVLELLPGEDETLLIGGDALLVLDLGLDVVDRVRGLDVEGDGLAGEGLDEDLHATTETKYEVEGGLLLDVVVGEGASVLELLPGEDETLLIGGDSLLVLDLGLDIVDGVGWLDVEGDGLAGEGLDKNLRRKKRRQKQHEVRPELENHNSYISGLRALTCMVMICSRREEIE